MKYFEPEILELAKEFKKRRINQNLSQLGLSKLANLSQSIINKFENGKIDPNYSTIVKLDKALSLKEKASDKKAKDIMITNIKSISEESTISKALEYMIENDYSQLLVIDKGVLKGMIYERTILNAMSKKNNIYETRIKEIVDINPIIIHKEYPVSDLTYIFQNKNNKFVVVMSENIVEGIITKSDLFKD